MKIADFGGRVERPGSVCGATWPGDTDSRGFTLTAKILLNRAPSRSAASSVVARNTALPEETLSRFRRSATLTVVADRSMPVIFPPVNLSQIMETATPWPQPISRT